MFACLKNNIDDIFENADHAFKNVSFVFKTYLPRIKKLFNVRSIRILLNVQHVSKKCSTCI